MVFNVQNLKQTTKEKVEGIIGGRSTLIDITGFLVAASGGFPTTVGEVGPGLVDVLDPSDGGLEHRLDCRHSLTATLDVGRRRRGAVCGPVGVGSLRGVREEPLDAALDVLRALREELAVGQDVVAGFTAEALGSALALEEPLPTEGVDRDLGVGDVQDGLWTLLSLLGVLLNEGEALISQNSVKENFLCVSQTFFCAFWSFPVFIERFGN